MPLSQTECILNQILSEELFIIRREAFMTKFTEFDNGVEKLCSRDVSCNSVCTFLGFKSH